MEMIYDGTLVMPASHAVMNEDEMEKLDSGWAIQNRWDGYGVRIRMTGPTKVQTVVTGVYSLTSAQERSIASKNKVLW